MDADEDEVRARRAGSSAGGWDMMRMNAVCTMDVEPAAEAANDVAAALPRAAAAAAATKV